MRREPRTRGTWRIARRRCAAPPQDEVTVRLSGAAHQAASGQGPPADGVTVLVPGAVLAPAPTPQVAGAGEAPVFVDDSGNPQAAAAPRRRADRAAVDRFHRHGRCRAGGSDRSHLGRAGRRHAVYRAQCRRPTAPDGAARTARASRPAQAEARSRRSPHHRTGARQRRPEAQHRPRSRRPPSRRPPRPLPRPQRPPSPRPRLRRPPAARRPAVRRPRAGKPRVNANPLRRPNPGLGSPHGSPGTPRGPRSMLRPRARNHQSPESRSTAMVARGWLPTSAASCGVRPAMRCGRLPLHGIQSWG